MCSPSQPLDSPLRCVLSRSHTDQHNINQNPAHKLPFFLEHHLFRLQRFVCECECVHRRLSPRLGWNSCLWLEGKLSRSKLDFMLSPSQQQYATLRQTHLPSAFTTKLALWFFKGWSFKHSCMTFFFFLGLVLMSALPKCGNYQLSISATKLKMLVVNHRHTSGVICDQMLDQLCLAFLCTSTWGWKPNPNAVSPVVFWLLDTLPPHGCLCLCCSDSKGVFVRRQAG